MTYLSEQKIDLSKGGRLSRETYQKRNWLRQRDRILAVSGRLFWQKGYLGTSIDDIAKSAEVNKATIYYYFKSKALILYELASRTMKTLTDQAEPIMNSDLSPGKKLEVLMGNHIKWELTHVGLAGIGQIERKNLPRTMLRDYVKMRDDYEALFRQAIEEVITWGGAKPAPNQIKLASMFAFGLMASIAHWYKQSGELSAEDVAARAATFIFEGLKLPLPAANN